MVKEPTETEDGELLKEYVCSYCKRIKRKNVVLTHKIKEKSDTALLIADPLAYDSRIAVVKIEIHGTKGEIKEFDFQNLDQARQFLKEFDFEKVVDEAH